MHLKTASDTAYAETWRQTVRCSAGHCVALYVVLHVAPHVIFLVTLYVSYHMWYYTRCLYVKRLWCICGIVHSNVCEALYVVVFGASIRSTMHMEPSLIRFVACHMWHSV